MAKRKTFGDVLEAVEQLAPDEQETLVTILNRRRAERGRQRVIAEVKKAEKEYRAGKCKPTTPEELMREILS